MISCSFIDVISVTAGIISSIAGVIAIYEFLIKRKLRECKTISILYNITYHLNISKNEKNYDASKEKIKEYAKEFHYYYSQYDHIKYFIRRMNFPELESLSTDKEVYCFFKRIPPVKILEFINIYSFNYNFGITSLISYIYNKIIEIISHFLYFTLGFFREILVVINGIFCALYSSKKEAFIFIIFFISSIYIIGNFINIFYLTLDYTLKAISYITGPIAGDYL